MIGLCGFGKIGKLLYEKLIICYDVKLVKSEQDLDGIKTLIDFSSPTAQTIIDTALDKKINIIMGTTGYDLNVIEKFKEKALLNNVIFYSCCNYAYGISIFENLCKQLKGLDIYLTEIHDISKKDCPSGTAIMIAKEFNIPLENITSIRKKGVFTSHKVIYKTNDEVITISHVVKSKKAYVDGFLEFFKKLVKENDKRII